MFAGTVLLFTGLVYPIETSFFVNRTSRLPSLLPVDIHSGAGLWKNLITEYESLTKTTKVKRIISDPITTFVLAAAVDGKIKEFRSNTYFPKYNSEYIHDLENSDHSSSVLIINRKNGEVTFSARHARHWAVNSLQVSNYYPSDIDNYVTNNKILKLVSSSELAKIYIFPE